MRVCKYVQIPNAPDNKLDTFSAHKLLYITRSFYAQGLAIFINRSTGRNA